MTNPTARKRHWVAKLATLPSVALAVAACANNPGSGGVTWACSAAGIQSGAYDGSGRAQIHLMGYPSGGSYAVKLNREGTVATGNTADGTPFNCIRGDHGGSR